MDLRSLKNVICFYLCLVFFCRNRRAKHECLNRIKFWIAYLKNDAAFPLGQESQGIC